MIHRSGGFDALRLVAAAMVIFGHSFPLTGHADSPGLLANSVQTIGVKIFFVISGYLITRSWQSDPHFGTLLAQKIPPNHARSDRHLLAHSPGRRSSAKQLPVFDYFKHSGTTFYFWNVALYPIYDLPGVFTDNIYPGA